MWLSITLWTLLAYVAITGLAEQQINEAGETFFTVKKETVMDKVFFWFVAVSVMVFAPIIVASNLISFLIEGFENNNGKPV